MFNARIVTVGNFTATLSIVNGGQLKVEWEPDIPKRGEITQANLAAYKKARNALYANYAKTTGLKILVVD